MVRDVLPPDAAVVVVADRAFGCPVFTDQVTAYGWDWVVRVQNQTRWQDRCGRETQLRHLVQHAGQRWKGRGPIFKGEGWRTCSVVVLWGQRHRDPLLLASSLPVGWDLIALSKQRAAIEALFRDWKTSGWNWEASQVRELAHQERLLLGLAFATLITLMLGAEAAAAERQTPARGMAPPLF